MWEAHSPQLEKLVWHKGEALIDLMEAIPVESNKANDGVFQIQYVIRPKREAFHDYRGFARDPRLPRCVAIRYRVGATYERNFESLAPTLLNIACLSCYT